MKWIVSGVLIVLMSLPLQAQTFDAWAPGSRHLADNLSTGVLAGTIGADVTQSLVTGHKQGKIWTAIGCEALKYGIGNGASISLKKLFPRMRPDGSDNQDSFSEHTMNATISTGWSYGFSVPVAVAVGYLRGAANRHDLVGVLEGAGLGVATRYAVTRIPACKGVS
jgi:hypothetical protein